MGAGTGLIYLLRWFWWRINAWSEIAAMVSSFILAAALFIGERRAHDSGAYQPARDHRDHHRGVVDDGFYDSADRPRNAAELLREGPPRGSWLVGDPSGVSGHAVAR